MSEIHEMKSLTLKDETFNSFPDRQAREDVLKKLPLPDGTAKVGQYLRVLSVDAEGKITGVEAVEAPAGEGSVTDEQVAQAVSDYMTANPVETGATAEQAAQIRKNADDIASLQQSGGTGGSATVVNIYKTEDIGELFAAPANYTAWCPGNLRWDKNLGKFVSLIYAAPAHVHTTAELYVTYIDPDSFVAADPVKCKYVDTDGETDITPASAGCCSFLILSDGTYLMIRNMDDDVTYKFTSADNGVTWTKVSAVTGYSGHPWNMTELSNGRIIMSDDSTRVGFYYSDDDGVNWTQVIPETVGGGYEAEACILEVEKGKLIAIARYSMSGKGYYESGDSEAAIFASSEDYGTTWSAWKISSVDNMNASSCTGIVHDGIVEIFATSRWYSNGSNVNTDNANTGKNGAMLHYMATAANALKDNFTRVGIVDYARGAGGEYHSPCAAVDDDGRMLIVHMDGGEKVTCNNRYIRGELSGVNYQCTKDAKSNIKAFSAAHVTALFAEQKDQILALQLALSKIEGSGVDAPTGTGVLVASYVADDMAESGIYPWQTGSDFDNSPNPGYPNNTGTTHKFTQDDNGEYYITTYNCGLRKFVSEEAIDNYLSFTFGATVGAGSILLCVSNGYMSALYCAGGGALHTVAVSGTQDLNTKLTSGDSIELHIGYFLLNGAKMEIPKVCVEDFLTNYTEFTGFSNVIYMQACKNNGLTAMTTTLSAEQIASVTTLDDISAVVMKQYFDFYEFKCYEVY